MNEYEKEMLDLYRRSQGEKQDFHGIVCPSSYKKPCRLCDLCKDVLFNRSIPKEAPLRKRASSLNAKQHYFSNVLFLADPTKVVVFEYGEKIFKQLLAMQMNPSQGFVDFWHPIGGRWLIIERIQGATREQVDYYVKPKDPSKLGDMSVLSNMYDLSTIAEQIAVDKVKPVYQSKLEKTTILRILPSWLGPEFALKFFQKVDYHYNISEEDFKSCLAGEINPVRIDGGEQAQKTIDITPYKESTASWTVPEQKETQSTKKEVNEWEKMWGESNKTTPLPKPVRQEIKEPAVKEETVESDDELPPCYGDYDPSEADCTTKSCPDWSDGCRQYREEKLAKRRAVKRLSR